MDNATHAFAGLLLADATTAWIERRTGTPSNRRLRRAIVGLGIVAAELPDADLLYSGPVVGLGKLGYLLHHRGHTHTVLFAVAAAVLMWWAVLAIRRRAAEQFDARERTPLLVLAMTASLSHLLLDYSNSYGVHPFWPVDNRWVYGDAVFIWNRGFGLWPSRPCCSDRAACGAVCCCRRCCASSSLPRGRWVS